VIRAIGDPRLRLGEDKLRMLRAVRFAAAFNFQIEPATLAAIQHMAAEVTTVSAERIGMEVRRMITCENRGVALALLMETQLLPQVLPEIAQLDANRFAETTRLLQRLESPSLSLALAALLLPVTSENVAATVGRRLRFTNKEIERTAWLLGNAAVIGDAPELPWPRLQRLLIHDGAAELIALREAIAGSDDAALLFCRERSAWPAERLNPAPLVVGGDLIAHGLAPGPKFAPLLEQIRNAQLNGQIKTREEALALVDRLR
jgi:tRNA nucleotidyltransferase/poly(A) polymerase